MTQGEWYRNSDWDAAIEETFEAGLRRARNKSQYLRIQASYLAETHPTVAVELINRYFGLGEDFDMASAHHVRARALIALNDIGGALQAYEAALKRESEFPRLKTQTYLDFPCLVLSARIEPMYARALEVLETDRSILMFPSDRFRAYGARALLLQYFGRTGEARASATLAMAAARETRSGFRYHQNVGIVSSRYDEFAMNVAALAEG